ncbi:hypothetical protein GWN42_02450 [candidate division KSB1 bacterium]|nr:hypothetical protein [candidate division KSB1 bacterium]
MKFAWFFLAVLLLYVSCDFLRSKNESEVVVSSANFKSKRISKTSIITLHAPLEKVFPLFGPVREKEWAEGWNPEIVYSDNELVEEHMVFKTRSHGHGQNYTWIVSKYLPEQSLIEYTVFATERLWYITIKCKRDTLDQTTDAEITYTYTGLTENGNAMNEKALQAMYSKDLKDWEEPLNYYLKTGERLKHHSL